jgi:hypothetical protein
LIHVTPRRGSDHRTSSAVSFQFTHASRYRLRLIRNAESSGMYCRVLSNSLRNPVRIGCGTVCDELQDWTSFRTIGISSCRVGAPRCEAVHTTRSLGARVVLLVRGRSRGFLGCIIKKGLSFFSRKEVEQTLNRIQEHARVASVEIGSRQEIGTDHLQTISS